MPKAEEGKTVIENAILEYKQILEVAKNKVLESRTKEIDEVFTRLLKENDLSIYNEPEMVKEESQSIEANVQESTPVDNTEVINMKEASLQEIEDAFNAADDEDEFRVVKSDDGQQNGDFSLSDIEGEISEVMSEIEAAENAGLVDGSGGEMPEEDNLTKIKKIHEEMGKMISAMDAEKNEVAMKENFHNKMMETFGEGYENSIGMNECGKMYETFKKKSSMNETEASVTPPKASSAAPAPKAVVAENNGVSAGKSNVPNTFTPKAAATSGTYNAKPVEKSLNKAIKEDMNVSAPVNEDPVNVAAIAAGLAGIVGSSVGIAKLMDYLKAKYPSAYQTMSNLGSAAKGSIDKFNGVQEDMSMPSAPVNEDPVNVAAIAAGLAGIVGSSVGISQLMDYLKAKYPSAYQTMSNLGSAAKGSIDKFHGIEETHGVGLSSNKLVNGTNAPQLDHKEYAKDKVRLALQKEGTEKLQKRINTLVNENFEITKQLNKTKAMLAESTKINESYRDAIDKYRKQLNEMALVSTNIANVNNILVNESLALSFDDKKSMINEFKKVKTVEESEKTYKKVIKEFSEAKKTIKESVENKINSAIESSSSEEVKKGVEGGVINEHVNKIKNLINYKHKN
jgi:hypothetical protein